MRVIDLLTNEEPTLSFEVFPPKKETAYENVKAATEKIAALKPSYMSVTYGAGGGTSKYTIDIASNLLSHGVTPVPHITCVSTPKDEISRLLDQMKEKKIENVLALRGDIPEGARDRDKWSFQHASDLAAFIKERGDFCIGGACYPEGHPESKDLKEDALNLKKKQDAGVDYLVTQMFFDNDILFHYLYVLRELGVTIPVVPGIMPITKASQVKRSIELSGSYMPRRFLQLVDRYGDNPKAMKQAGIIYATDQIIDLFANGINHVHVYSMNDPEVAQKIQENISGILGRD